MYVNIKKNQVIEKREKRSNGTVFKIIVNTRLSETKRMKMKECNHKWYVLSTTQQDVSLMLENIVNARNMELLSVQLKRSGKKLQRLSLIFEKIIRG